MTEQISKKICAFNTTLNKYMTIDLMNVHSIACIMSLFIIRYIIIIIMIVLVY